MREVQYGYMNSILLILIILINNSSINSGSTSIIRYSSSSNNLEDVAGITVTNRSKALYSEIMYTLPYQLKTQHISRLVRAL